MKRNIIKCNPIAAEKFVFDESKAMQELVLNLQRELDTISPEGGHEVDFVVGREEDGSELHIGFMTPHIEKSDTKSNKDKKHAKKSNKKKTIKKTG